MEDRETARMRKYGESKTTRIMMATVPHVISGLGLRKFQAEGFLLTRVYRRVSAVNLQLSSVQLINTFHSVRCVKRTSRHTGPIRRLAQRFTESENASWK